MKPIYVLFAVSCLLCTNLSDNLEESFQKRSSSVTIFYFFLSMKGHPVLTIWKKVSRKYHTVWQFFYFFSSMKGHPVLTIWRGGKSFLSIPRANESLDRWESSTWPLLLYGYTTPSCLRQKSKAICNPHAKLPQNVSKWTNKTISGLFVVREVAKLSK